MFNVSKQALAAIQRGVERGDTIAEMEAAGVSQRIINALEESEFEIIYVEQLLHTELEDLLCIQNIGVSAIEQLSNALKNYDVLEKFILSEASCCAA